MPAPCRRLVTARLHRDGAGVDVYDGVAEEQRDPKLLERARRLAGERRRERRQYAVRHLDQQHRRLSSIDGTEVPAQRVTCQLGNLSRHLDPGRAGAGDDESQPGLPLLGVGFNLRGLKRAEDTAADVESTLERLELRRIRPPIVVAEVGVLRAATDDQRVVGKTGSHVPIGKAASDHLTPFQIEVDDLAEQHAGVLLALEH